MKIRYKVASVIYVFIGIFCDTCHKFSAVAVSALMLLFGILKGV